MDDLMDAFANSAFFAVHIENIKGMLLKETGLYRVHAYMTAQIIKYGSAVHMKGLGQSFCDLLFTGCPVIRIQGNLLVDRIFQLDIKNV